MPTNDFAEGDRLAQAGDHSALLYGWWANAWIEQEAALSDADPTSRAAFSYALTTLEQHHGKWLSRSQITDRIRVGRIFPENTYKDLVTEIHYTPSFSQLRAAYVKDDDQATMALILWAAENDASPMAIQAKKMGEVIESEEEKAWRHFVEWGMKFLDRTTGECKERCRLAREVASYQDRNK